MRRNRFVALLVTLFLGFSVFLASPSQAASVEKSTPTWNCGNGSTVQGRYVKYTSGSNIQVHASGYFVTSTYPNYITSVEFEQFEAGLPNGGLTDVIIGGQYYARSRSLYAGTAWQSGTDWASDQIKVTVTRSNGTVCNFTWSMI